MRALSRSLPVLVAILLAACGGPSERRTPAAHGGSREAPESAEPAAEAEEDGARAEPGPASACSDGSCFQCGKGFCMTGFFCDEAAEGGAACSWLPSCAKKASCECVERVLGAACRCSEKGGTVSVSCG